MCRRLWIKVPVPPCGRLTTTWWIQAFSSHLPKQRKQRYDIYFSIFPPNAAVFMFSFFLNASSYSQPQTTWDTNTPQMNHGLKMNQLFLSNRNFCVRLTQLYCHKTVCVYLSYIGPECLFASVKTASRLILPFWPLTFSSAEFVWGGGGLVSVMSHI